MSTQDCDRGTAPTRRDEWEYDSCVDGNLVGPLAGLGADGWEAYAAVVVDNGHGGQDVRHYLKRRVAR